MSFSKNDKIVLIGDSITDAGRTSDPEKIGNGYFRLIHDYFITQYPTLNLSFINKGVGGDRVTDLEKRWDKDVLALQPDWVSVSIGINDVWRQLDRPNIDQVYPDKFIDVYHDLLTRLKQSTNARIIVMEPTIIEEDIHSEGNQMLIPYVEGVQEVAKEFDAILVPTHQAFKKFLKYNTGNSLTTDGVHMTSIGNMLMANTWIETLTS